MEPIQNWKTVLLAVILLALSSGCSLQRLALRTTTGLMVHGVDAIYRETDLEIARMAIASNLKLLEGFLDADPKNPRLLGLLTQGFASYSLAFLEDVAPERASALYLRARDYGFRWLQTTPAFKDGIPDQQQAFEARLKRVRKKDLPALFWTAFAWGGWVNLNRDLPRAVFELNLVKAMMQRVLELDEGFFFGSAHLFFGSILGSIPRMLGGDPEKAREHFERALQLSQGKFLVAYVYSARYYAATTLNETLFDQYLNKVLEAPVDILPGYQLMTVVAKEKARRLMARKSELF
ncbi:MAG: hypothetical protein D6715_09915 [Calditrichaeota bacterium]|nr:MAG: hypothetical protein D6715_09915 [Calditrichota bacterium]